MLQATKYWPIKRSKGKNECSKCIQGSKGTYNSKKCNSNKPQPFKVARNSIFQKKSKMAANNVTYFLTIQNDSE